MHRYAALCMVTSSDFRLAGPRGELVHEACLASTGTSRGRVMTRPFERGLQQWSFSPRSANVFRRWPAIDCFFDHLARMGRESSDGTAEWLLLYYAQALGGSFRWAECLGTLALRPDDRVMDVARGLPAFGAHPALNVDRVRVFLFGLLCTHHEQLVALVTPATLGGFARWLRAGASPQVIALMKSQAVAAGADPQIVAMLEYEQMKRDRKRVLVTGGAGFLGSHLCERLLREGADVLCVDNFYTGTKDNILHLLGDPHFEVMRHDVTFPLYVEVDEIYNLACPASPVHYQFDPVQTTKTSVHGAINILGLAKRVKARVFQASTSEVYGDPTVHPQREDYWGNVNPIGLRSCYDEGKRCAETLFFDYHRQHGLRIKVARIFNTYGPRMHPNDGRVVSSFIMQALGSEPITIFGSGDQTRSFCHVDDMVEGIVRLMDTADAVTGPVNLGNPDELTIFQLAQKIVSLAGSKSRIEFKPLPSDDPMQRQPDIGLARRLLGWEPARLAGRRARAARSTISGPCR